jgi:predicted O-methyltransferase YrrM
MKRPLAFAGLLAASLASMLAVTHAQPPDIQKLLKAIKARDTGQLAVSEEDGRFLRVLVTSSGTKRALESIEYDPVRAKELAENIKRAGLSDVVSVVAGDAFKAIPGISGSFDFVFLDAWKKDYKRFFDLIVPRLDKGGLFVAHNVINKRSEMGDFLDAIWKNPALWTTIVSPSSEGMSVSVKR